MEIISNRLEVVRDVENLVPVAANLQKIKKINAILPSFIEKDQKVIDENLQLYVALLEAYQVDEDWENTTVIASKMYAESEKINIPRFTIQAQYNYACALLNENKIFEAKKILDEMEDLDCTEFHYLYYSGLAKLYDIKQNTSEEIKNFQIALNLALKSGCMKRIEFEILCGLALAFEKSREYNRALMIYEKMQEPEFEIHKFLSYERIASIFYREARIHGYLNLHKERADLLTSLHNNIECTLPENHPLRILVAEDFKKL